ncbi:MFS transporter [Actinokineospora diospyrosa]|uniref:MFS transporter n=1 Tax=Actinokineospora diospyrosa TaxID=103728 RepID=UPI0020A3E778|nr:MFS transporter [Actinokineospora diospyrosa]
MRRPLWTLPSAFAVFLALGASAAAWGAALPQLRQRYDLGPTGGEEVISAFNLGALVAVLGCGLAARYLPPRPTLAGLLAAFGCGLVGAAQAPNWGFLLVSALVAGVGFGGVALHLNTTYAAGPRGVLLANLVNAMFGVGAIAAPLLVAGLSASTALMSIAAVVALSVPLVSGAVRERPPTPPVGRATVVLLAPFALIGFLYAGVETSAGAWAGTHLTWTGTAPDTAARLTALFWAGLAVGRLLVPLVATRPAVIVPTAFAVTTAGLLLATHPPLAVVGYAIAGLGLAPIIPTALAWLAHLTPHAHLAGSALLTCSMLGSALHPLLVGLVASPQHPTTIPLALTTYAVLGLLAALWTARHRTPHLAGTTQP